MDTLNHAHTSLFGAFGLLGIGLIYFCLRYVAADRYPFGEKLGKTAFWLYNGGMVLWIFLNFFPIGWPRGLTKTKAKVDLWMRDIAPSTELRKWFNYNPDKWAGFKTRYRSELKKNDEQMTLLKKETRKGTITLLHGAKDEEHNAAILKERTGYARNRVFAATEALQIISRPFGSAPYIA